MSIFEQIASLFIFLTPCFIFLCSQLFLGDDQRSQALPRQRIALVLDVASVDGFATLYHDHVCSLEVEDESIGFDVFHDDSHAFCLAGEGKIGQNFIYFFFLGRERDGEVVLSSLLQYKTEFLCEFDQSYLVWA